MESARVAEVLINNLYLEIRKNMEERFAMESGRVAEVLINRHLRSFISLLVFYCFFGSLVASLVALIISLTSGGRAFSCVSRIISSIS